MSITARVNTGEQLARHSKVTLEPVRKIERYRKYNRGLLTIKVILSPSPNTSFFQLQSRRATPKQVNKGKRAILLISFFRAKLEPDDLGWVVQRTGKYCSIRRMEYPEFQTGIFGRMESAHGLRPRLRFN